LVQHSLRGKVVSPGNESRDISLTDIWLVIRKRRWLLASMALGCAALFAVGGILHGKRYTATGELQIQPNATADLKSALASAMGGSGDLDTIMESDTLILNSRSLLLAVATELKLPDSPAFLGSPKSPLLHRSLNDPRVQAAMVGMLRGGLSVQAIPRSQMITVSYESRSPALSADVANALVNEFIKKNFTMQYNTTTQASKWLTGQLDDLRASVQSEQDQMVDLSKNLGVDALDPKHDSLIQGELSALDRTVADDTEQRVLAEARYRTLQSMPLDQIEDSGVTPLGSDAGLLTQLRVQRDTAAAQLAKLRPVYGPNYPAVRQLNAQIATIDRQMAAQESRIVDQAKSSLAVAQTAETQARGALSGRIEKMFGQRNDMEKYMLLSEDYESNRLMYESLIGRLREAAVDAGLNAATVSIVDLAPTPLGPSSHSPEMLGIVGFLFGVLGGLGLALFIEKIDTRLRDAHDIQEILGLPSLAVIPLSRWKSREGDLELAAGPELLRDPRSPFAEAFRALRTSMRLSTTSRESKVIAVTSCQPGEGKSTITVNMAAVLAQGGKRVVLVDTDMRRPSVYKRLGMEGGKGLSEVLTGYFSLDDVIHTHQTLKTLDIIPSGTVPPLPADLLASDQMVELVRQLRERYDYVIFDTPPVLSVTDPAIVAAQSDGMVMVIRQGYCTRRMLSRAAEILHDLDVKVYGFVFNGVDASLPEYYGYLGYYTYEYGK
jgi:capsular exopolysaccharide synthesis family protein